MEKKREILEEQIKQALTSTFKVISNHIEDKNSKNKDLKIKTLDFSEVKDLKSKDDYIRLRANTDSNNSVLTYGNIKMDTGTHRVYCCDQEAKLGPREYRILEFLMRNPGRVYSRQQILDSVWGTNVYVTDRTIDVHIRRLRKALSSTEECKVIRTIRSSGYSLDSQS